MTCWQGRGEKWSMFPQDPPRSLLTAVRTRRAPMQPQNSSSPAPHVAPRPRRTVPHPRLARATLAPHPRLTRASPAPHSAAPAPRPRSTCASPAPHPRLACAAPEPRPRRTRRPPALTSNYWLSPNIGEGDRLRRLGCAKRF